MSKFSKMVLLSLVIFSLTACGSNSSSTNVNKEVLTHSKELVVALDECYSKIFSCDQLDVQSYGYVYMDQYYALIDEGKLNEDEKKLVDDVVSLSMHLDELFLGNHESAKKFEDELTVLKQNLNISE